MCRVDDLSSWSSLSSTSWVLQGTPGSLQWAVARISAFRSEGVRAVVCVLRGEIYVGIRGHMRLLGENDKSAAEGPDIVFACAHPTCHGYTMPRLPTKKVHSRMHV